MIFHSSRESDFLADIDGAVRQILFDAGNRKSLTAGQSIQRDGDAERSLMVVQSGRVRLSKTGAEGKRTTLAHLGEGDVLGLFALIVDRPKAYDAEAEIATKLLLVDKAAFNRLLDREPLFRNHVFQFLARRLESAFQALSDERSLPLVFKTAKALLYYADAEGWVRLTQQALAEQLGASRNGLGLALRSLSEEGLIERHYGSIRIAAPDRLNKRLSDAEMQNDLFR